MLRLRLAMTIFYACFVVLCLSSCTPLPKIIVLHDPLTVDEHISLGLSYELKGEYDYALQEYKKALEKEERDYRPLFYIGNVYYKEGEYEAAKEYYNKALRLAPDNGDIHNNLAWVYMDTAKPEEAKGEIERALRVKKDPYYMDTLANIYDKMGNYEEAVKVLKEAIDITPAADMALLYNEYKLLSEVYENLGKDIEAMKAREKAEEYKKNNE